MSDQRRDLKQTAMHLSRAALEVRWTARDLRSFGLDEHASVLEQLLQDMDSVGDRLYEWSSAVDVPNISFDK